MFFPIKTQNIDIRKHRSICSSTAEALLQTVSVEVGSRNETKP